MFRSKRANPDVRIIMCNDGGTLAAPGMEAPIGVEGLVAGTIDIIKRSSIDTLYWQLGTDPFYGTQTHRLSDWYSHRTTVGARWGQGRAVFKTAGEWRIFTTTQQMFDAGTDPAALVIEEGHKVGLDVFLAMRVNDGHDFALPDGLADDNMSPMRKAHPEWLLGDAAVLHASVDPHHRKHATFAYDFNVDEVRAYVLALITEAIDNYDLDGFDLDFCRQPSLFKEGEAARGAPLLTKLLRDIRGALDRKGALVGRKLELSVRVPPSFKANLEVGFELNTWIAERLIDTMIIGELSGWNYELPLAPYLAATKGSGCRVIAQDLCAFHEERGRSVNVLFGESNFYSPEQYRAVAATHWLAGSQGQFVWNQHFLKFIAHTGDPQSWNEIGDRDLLARLNKHYLVNGASRGGPLPVLLQSAGESSEVRFTLADDFTPREAPIRAPRAVLRLLVEQLTSLDRLQLSLNGTRLDLAAATRRLNYNDCWLDIDVSLLARQGDNFLSLQLEARNPHVGAPLVLKSLETLVSYD